MIAELGHFALILALMASIMQIIYPLMTSLEERATFLVTRRLSLLTFCAILFSFLMLIISFVQLDLSHALVVQHAHSTTPLFYKITATWGNHEGSMLLWVLMLSLFATGMGYHIPATFLTRHDSYPLYSLLHRALIAQALLLLGFIAFVLLTSNPFQRLDPPPLDGQELNPLLQDIALAFHPPMLYLGYVGFSAIFSYAVAALWLGRIDALWAQLIRTPALIAWCSLTLGIALGSFWAYYELGWGGFWFWDPVENLSLTPWVTATALIHALLVFEKRHHFPLWTLFLALITFSMSMVGTFLVRSGILVSVHSFANDPERGLFILALISIYAFTAFSLFAYRFLHAPRPIPLYPLSRETALIGNNVLTLVLAFFILTGTLYPLILDVLTQTRLSVGAPFFNHVGSLIILPMLVLMAYMPFLQWHNTDITTIAKPCLMVTALFVLAISAAIQQNDPRLILPLCVLFACIVMMTTTLSRYAYQLWRAVKTHRMPPIQQHAMPIAHCGFACCLAAAVSASLFQQESIQFQRIDETITMGPWTMTLLDVHKTHKDNYISQQASMRVSREGYDDITMTPEKRFYPASQDTTTEAAIHTTWQGDLYIAFDTPPETSQDTAQEREEGDIWITNIWFKPFVLWIWLGALLMAGASLLAMMGRITISQHPPKTS
ncbi:MAG: heme lyase CcmF/NrfE family subunit [Alphaproteobacteria bacterium GM7ARS4]|nr:heme lyase CcmF/NrfE family subunit [Alphaproteobacteria bacterium GM7ARS4]